MTTKIHIRNRSGDVSPAFLDIPECVPIVPDAICDIPERLRNVIANGGNRQTLIDARNDKRDILEMWNTRVRGAYIAASDDGEYTKELSKMGLRPKRLSGQAQAEPKPDAPGTGTFDAAGRTLTTPAVPAHATSLIACRQPAGGAAVQTDVSTGTSVSVVTYGPLVPGVTYTFRVEGTNSPGEGPKSNVITFAA